LEAGAIQVIAGLFAETGGALFQEDRAKGLFEEEEPEQSGDAGSNRERVEYPAPTSVIC